MENIFNNFIEYSFSSFFNLSSSIFFKNLDKIRYKSLILNLASIKKKEEIAFSILSLITLRKFIF